jgi:hypothetical protein
LSEILVETPVLLDDEHYVLDLGAASRRECRVSATARNNISNTGKIAQDARAAFTEVTLLTGTRIWKKQFPRHRNPNDFLRPWRFSWA